MRLVRAKGGLRMYASVRDSNTWAPAASPEISGTGLSGLEAPPLYQLDFDDFFLTQLLDDPVLPVHETDCASAGEGDHG